MSEATIEERLEALEKENAALKQTIASAYQEHVNMFRVLQDLLGIQMVYDKPTKRFGLRIQVPKKDEAKTGVLADLYIKMDKLWKRYGGEIFIPG